MLFGVYAGVILDVYARTYMNLKITIMMIIIIIIITFRILIASMRNKKDQQSKTVVNHPNFTISMDGKTHQNIGGFIDID